MDALFTLANGKSTLPGTPYQIIEADGSIFVQWSPAYTYNNGVGVIFNGNPFISKINGNNFMPTNSVVWQGVTDQGAWNSSQVYNALDKASYGGYEFVTPLGCAANNQPLNGSGNLNTGWMQMWLSAYNRLRNNWYSLVWNPPVSGPWPFTGVSSASYTGNNSNIVFFFEDTGNLESVAITTPTGTIPFAQYSIDPNIVAATSSGGSASPYSSFTSYIAIGGNVSVNLVCRFVTHGPGTTTCTSNTMGLSFTSSGSDCYCDVNGTFAPGIYSFTFLFAVPALAGNVPAMSITTFGGGSGLGYISFTTSGQTLTNGIDSTKDVYKIVCPVVPVGPLPFGFYAVTIVATPRGIDIKIPYTGTTANPTFEYAWESAFPTYTPSCAGIFFGNTDPIQSLGLLIQPAMPWNLVYYASGTYALKPVVQISGHWPLPPLPLNQPYKTTLTIAGSSPSQTIAASAYTAAYGPWEKENCPSRWKANTWYPTGWQIYDSNGNIQTLTSAGSSIGALSGSSEPTWETTLYAGITEGGYTINSGMVHQCGWQLTNLLNKNLVDGWLPSTTFIPNQTITDKNGNTQKVISVSGSLLTGATEPAWPSAIKPVWQGSIPWEFGVIILDSNGNLQQVQTTGGGVAGATLPVWATVLNVTTTDGALTWKCVLVGNDQTVVDGGITWQLVSVNGLPMVPAVARQFSIPKYPTCRDTAPVSLPTAFNPEAWWIYEVSLTRLGIVDANGISQPQSGTVAVTLGCIRNGSFVSFGTWNTGQIIPAMWPIFTNPSAVYPVLPAAPLVYQCTEAVDVQAVAISCGLGYSTGGTVTYPICAAFYNDMAALLALIT
jgi:hypothetical protein